MKVRISKRAFIMKPETLYVVVTAHTNARAENVGV